MSMKDQAESLRLQLQQFNVKKEKSTKAIAVLSGKGGVGKSNISLNFSLQLCQQGYKVLLCDMDIGMGNIDILIGQSSPYTLVDMFEKHLPIEEIIRKGPENLSYISAGSGVDEIFDLSSDRVNSLILNFESLMHMYDYIIFDMGAGMTEGMLRFFKTVDEIIIVTTPEPTAITDAYGAVKLISLNKISTPFYFVINKIESEKEGLSVYRRLRNAIQQFLSRETRLLGFIPYDKAISRAVIRQVPFLLFDPKSEASNAVRQLSTRYLTSVFSESAAVPSSNFITRLRKYFFSK